MDIALQKRVVENLLEEVAELEAENNRLRQEGTLGANYVFVGCYSEPAGHIAGDELGKGVYTFKLNTDGSLTEASVSNFSRNPSMVCVSANKQFLYATNEVDDFAGRQPDCIGVVTKIHDQTHAPRFSGKDTQTSSLEAFKIRNGGSLTSLGIKNTKGDANCSVACTNDS